MPDYFLDAKDKRILRILDMDARTPVTQISKSVGLSRQMTEYRIRRLEKSGVVTGYYAVCDQTRMGQMIFRLRLEYREINPDKEEDIYEYCRREPGITWCAKLEGKWDVIIVIVADSPSEYKDIAYKFLFRFGHYIKDNNESIATKIYHLKHKYLYERNDSSCMVVGDSPGKADMDEMDHRIIHELTLNARIGLVEMQQRLGIGANTVRYRIEKLTRQKVIRGFRSVINIGLLGYQHYKVYLYLANLNISIMNQLIGYMVSHRNIVYITESIGEGDLEFEAQVKNSSELYELIRQMSRDFSGVIKDYYVLLLFKDIDLGSKKSKSFESS